MVDKHSQLLLEVSDSEVQQVRFAAHLGPTAIMAPSEGC